MLVMGMVLSAMGTDPLSGIPRFTYGSVNLMKGVDLISMLIGLFGIGEILISLEEEVIAIAKESLGKLMPTGKELADCTWTILRSTGVGFGLGLLPGMIPAVTSFIAYDVEKRVSKNASRFGKGAIEGVCAPETANNATAVAGYIPLMVFGIPPSPSLAILLAGLMIYGLEPGPLLFTKNANFVWTVIGSMFIGNVILLILNLPLVGLWARIAYIPYRILAPIILGICFLGAYSSRNSMLDVGTAVVFGLIGYVMRKSDWPIAPMILGFILGPMFESVLRQSLSISGGSISVVLFRPIPAGFITLSLVLVGINAYLRIRNKRKRLRV